MSFGVGDVIRVMKECPRVVLHLGNTVVKRMSPFVRQIDFALDWSYVEAGRPIFRCVPVRLQFTYKQLQLSLHTLVTRS